MREIQHYLEGIAQKKKTHLESICNKKGMQLIFVIVFGESRLQSLTVLRTIKSMIV